MKTEAETLLEIEKLIDALEPDARKRAGEYLANRYAKAMPRYEFKPTPPHTCCSGPCCMPDLYAPGGPKWPAQSVTVVGPSPWLLEAAKRWTDEERLRFTACAPSLPEYVTLRQDDGMVFGPGAAIPAGPPMRTWS